MPENTLKLTNISKSFIQGDQKISVIKNFNLEIKKSELISLVGPSGSGKTTILQIAGLLDFPTSGEIEVNGIKVKTEDDQIRTKIRKENIGFIYQFHHLLPEFNAVENVAMPLLIQGKNPKESYEMARHILSEVGLSDRVNFKPSQLSGGQQQRVAIARAIVGKPSLILADEPTGNLDTDLAHKIFDVLLKLAKNYNIACLIVTHNSELSKKSDRTISILS